jgi:hypothetical protein
MGHCVNSRLIAPGLRDACDVLDACNTFTMLNLRPLYAAFLPYAIICAEH